ncbi:MAG: chromosomal replication initiator protein DnaA [Atopobiaceae bacterium]|nr:chromosomal replication initiator protein DnaA [Atopobiaceae bacterium]
MSTVDSDAAALWSDVLDLLEVRDLSPTTLQMLKTCVPVELDDSTLTVETGARFIQRTVEAQQSLIEECLEEAAFAPVKFNLVFSRQNRPTQIDTRSRVSAEEYNDLVETRSTTAGSQFGSLNGYPYGQRPMVPGMTVLSRNQNEERTRENPLVEEITERDSRLTFARFVQGEENAIALQAAKQVANGENKTYNPLFIYGRSGLGKTHLLKAIQNYIAENDPSRVCVYRGSRDFTSDYISAMVNTEKSVKDAFERNYRGVDVLIIDDIQYLKTSERTVEFFFDLFNYLVGHGKQVVLAADESPTELGLGEDGFDERITSRIDSGFSVPISAPEYELKYALIETFYDRMREDAVRDNIQGMDGTLSKDDLRLMAERSGANIRVIEGFTQSCLLYASRVERTEGRAVTPEEIIRIANEKWPMGQKAVTVEQIQKAVENEYGVSHNDLIGSKRAKEIMEPRHVAIWLTRELTDNTLAEIGNKFGGRSHATIKHSIGWVDDARKADRVFHDQVNRLRELLRNNS